MSISFIIGLILIIALILLIAGIIFKELWSNLTRKDFMYLILFLIVFLLFLIGLVIAAIG